MKVKIKIKDSKSLLDSINELKKKIMDAEPDLTREGVDSIANALLAIKDKVNETKGFAELRDLMIPVIKEFDTPKAKEYLIKIDEFNRLYNRDPRKGYRNDYWMWEKLMKLYYNIIMKAAGLGSPDVKPVKEDSCKVKDEDSQVLKLCKLLGEAHDKIMEALDLVEDLENDGMLNSDLRYEIEDLEADASDLDFMGESDPESALATRFAAEEDDSESYDGEAEDWDL